MSSSVVLPTRGVVVVLLLFVFIAGNVLYGINFLQQRFINNNEHHYQPPTQSTSDDNNKKDDDDDNPQLSRMNILLLYADDWRHDTLSIAGNPIVQTPNIDALATQGIHFTNNCVTTSVCWISRATLYTGQYMSRHNTTKPCCFNGHSEVGWRRQRDSGKQRTTPTNWNELSIYSLLKQHGYDTSFIGKWGIFLPFNKSVDFESVSDGWHYKRIRNKTWHITEKNEYDALRSLQTRPRNKPFFMTVAFYATHAVDDNVLQYMPQNSSMGLYNDNLVPLPNNDAKVDAQLYRNNNNNQSDNWKNGFGWDKLPYFFTEENEARNRWHWRYDNHTKYNSMMLNLYRMATEVDTACGRIMDELRRQGVYNNTFIIFTTDNGNFHGEHGLADKWYPHQESIRVPLIIRDPRMSDNVRGSKRDEFTLNIDLAPTILSAAGLQKPARMMGRDISDLYLTNKSTNNDSASKEEEEVIPWRNDFFYEHPTIQRKEFVPASEALVRKDYKYMFWPDYRGYEQLFDLINDPGEMNDIINSTDTIHVEKLREMRMRFKQLKSLVKSDKIVTL